jgi:hypothetical protein
MEGPAIRSGDYVYEALQPEKRQIRIVTLVAGNEAIIKMTLSAVSLDVEPQFEAVSYVWGDPIITIPTILDGHIFQVTENLNAALHRLRLPDLDRVLWIDAICINQNDNSERNSQVLLMGHIYSKCTKCDVWLGKEDEYTQATLEFFHWCEEDKHIWEWRGFADLTRESSTNQQGPDLDMFGKTLAQDRQPLLLFERLMNRPWWTRTWTVQELVLPRTVEFLCGPFIVDWEVFHKSLKWMSLHFPEIKCCHNYSFKTISLDQSMFYEVFQRLLTLQQLRDVRNSGAEVDMLILLTNFYYRLATDPRDKVYGFLGIFNNPGIVPDYNSGIPAAYAQPILRDIQHSRSLRALSYISQQNPIIGLPSWVPDWSFARRHSSLIIQQGQARCYNLYKACGTAFANQCIYKNSIFSISGVRHDIVSDSSGTVGLGSNFDEIVKNWAVKATANFERPPLQASIFRGLIQDAWAEKGDWMRASPENYEACRVFINAAARGEDAHSLDAKASECIAYAILERKLFITEGEYFGSGPKGIQAGDEVWILNGGKMPLILRPSKESKAIPELNLEVAPCHTLVGNCYVDGIMDGEAADTLVTNHVGVFIN